MIALAIPRQSEEIALEQRIAAALNLSLSADQRGDKAAAQRHLRAFHELHAMRTPETVRRMEVVRGIA